jgi:hypothetical protein
VGVPTGGIPFSFVVTSTGFLATHGVTSQGYAVKQSLPTCTNPGLTGSFGRGVKGVLLVGAPGPGPIAAVGELTYDTNASGDGIITGHLAGGDNATIFTFDEEPVWGTFSVNSDCSGTATISSSGLPEMHFSLVIVDGGKEVLTLETDANTVVSGTLLRRRNGTGEEPKRPGC